MDVFLPTRNWVTIALGLLSGCVWFQHQRTLVDAWGLAGVLVVCGAILTLRCAVICTQRKDSRVSGLRLAWLRMAWLRSAWPGWARLPEKRAHGLPVAGAQTSGLGGYATHLLMLFMLSYCIGYALTFARASHALDQRLTDRHFGEDLRVQGTIDGLVRRDARFARFLVSDVATVDRAVPRIAGKIRLSWYGAVPDLKPGERWGFTVRLKPVRGRRNVASFDAERWALVAGIGASGYVRNGEDAYRIRAAQRAWATRARAVVAEKLRASLEPGAVRALLMALAIGERAELDAAQWQQFRDTGTGHLVAISGLHVGFVAWLAALIVRSGVRQIPTVTRRWPASVAGALAALPAAFAYSALSGFALSTQRALIMITVVVGSVVLRREPGLIRCLAIALVFVLLLDSLAPLSAGFWLSFGAVAAIAIAHAIKRTSTGAATDTPLDGQKVSLSRQVVDRLVRLRPWLRMQFALSVGLLPLAMFWFGEGSVVSVLCNSLAIPLTAFIVVPSLLVGLLLSSITATGFDLLLSLAAAVSELLLWWIDFCARMPHARIERPAGQVLAGVLAATAILVLLMPRGVPGRWLAVFWWLPLLAGSSSTLNGLQLTVLDVGQGLATVVRTRDSVVVFDTGGRFGSHTEAARVLVPWLRVHGVQKIDLLLVSHLDNDHAGGVSDLRRLIPVVKTIASDRRGIKDAELCRRGARFVLGEIRLVVLSPPRSRSLRGRNNRSCVVRVEYGRFTALLTGDIEAEAETALVAHMADSLRADVLVVPHHGAATSSTLPFLNRVRPSAAIVSAGFRNRHDHPVPRVVARYRDRGIPIYNTATQGEITVAVAPGGVSWGLHSWRDRAVRYWHRLTP